MFLIFETILSLIVAIVLGILLSIPITTYSLRSSDFLEFNKEPLEEYRKAENSKEIILLMNQYIDSN